MLEILKNRFQANSNLHPGLQWPDVERRLRENPGIMEVLRQMEESGGEPDTIGFDEETGKLIFCDCARESPSGRRSLCYDDDALQKRTKNPPVGSAEKKAREIGISLLTEELYHRLQALGQFDRKPLPGSVRRKRSENKAEPCSARGVMALYSRSITERTRTIPRGDSEAISSYNVRITGLPAIRETGHKFFRFQFAEINDKGVGSHERKETDYHKTRRSD